MKVRELLAPYVGSHVVLELLDKSRNLTQRINFKRHKYYMNREVFMYNITSEEVIVDGDVWRNDRKRVKQSNSIKFVITILAEKNEIPPTEEEKRLVERTQNLAPRSEDDDSDNKPVYWSDIV